MPYNKPKKRPSCLLQSIVSLSSKGQLSQAVSYLELCSRKGIRLPSKTLASLIQQCADTKSLKEGTWVHLHLKLTGLKRPNTLLSNNLINMYFKCGKGLNARKVFDKMQFRNVYSWNNMLSGYVKSGMVTRARAVFDEMPVRDVVSWNTMVIGYSRSGDYEEALRFYRDLRREAIGFNEFSFSGVLTVCVKAKELTLTRQAHGQVLVAGFLSNVVLSSNFVDAYAKCGEINDARRLFDEMQVKDIPAWTTLVSGYAKCGEMELANELFENMPEKNPVSWTALIAGYARNGPGHKALELFSKMMSLGIQPDQFTFSSCLCASASVASLKHGKQIHAYLLRHSVRPNTIVVSSLIDMYAKCGNLEVSEQVFHLMGDMQDPVLWNTMISAVGQHGDGEKALIMLNDMLNSGVKSNRITLVVILNACSHSGLVNEGLKYFESMTCDHGIVADQEHYACLIDLLGRAGCFDELNKRIENMPFKPDSRVLKALLGVCRIHGNIELGRKAAEELIELEPQSSAAYVLLAGIYGALGRWESVEKVRKLMDTRCVRKEKAISWIETESKLHAFTVADGLHPRTEEIYSVLEQIGGLMEEDNLPLDVERSLSSGSFKASNLGWLGYTRLSSDSSQVVFVTGT